MIYLNNAATSYPKPPEVLSALDNYLQAFPFHPGRIGFSVGHSDCIQQSRKALADLFHARDPNQIIFTSGATEALNLVIRGFEFTGCHIVTTTTEHNSVIRPLKDLEASGRIALSLVPCDDQGRIDPEDVANALEPNTRAIVVNHCSNVTGTVLDIRSICDLAHDAKALAIVDASQSAGVYDIDVVRDLCLGI